MNDADNKQEQDKQKSAPKDNKPSDAPDSKSKTGSSHSGGTSVAGGLALVLSLAAVIGTGYLGYILLYKNPGLLQGDINTTTEVLIDDTRKLQEQLAENNKAIEDLATNQEAIKDAIEQTFSRLGRDRRGWAITETEQLLIIANHRLQLARDIPSAVAALDTADKQLRALADPRLLPVRKAIAEEVARLRELEPVDRAGIVLQLETLIDKTGGLQLSAKAREEAYRKERVQQTDETVSDNAAATKPVASEKPGPLAEIWNDIRNFVNIRTDVEKELPLLPPEQNWFLRENMKLMLSGARHALLANDKASYEHSLATTIKWINTYFDVNAKNTAAILEELNKLKATNIAIELPDISKSLKELRSLREQQ